MRRELPMLITLFTGTVIILDFFFPSIMKGITDVLQRWAIIIFAFAIMLGILNLFLIHLRKLLEPSTKPLDRGASALLIISLITAVLLGLIYTNEPDIVEAYTLKTEIVGGLVLPYIARITKDFNPFSVWIFNATYTPLQATMFSMLAFFIASAAYRAFRARSFEAFLLLVAAVLVMLGRVPLGIYLLGKLFPWIPADDIANWIMMIPNTAGQRAILIGAGFGAVAVSLKILLGIERSHLGKAE